MPLHTNSIEAHRTNRYSERHRQILDSIRAAGAGTDREIMHRLGQVDPNTVRPRITELVESGVLLEVGQRRDPITRKVVRVVDLRREPTKDVELYQQVMEF